LGRTKNKKRVQKKKRRSFLPILFLICIILGVILGINIEKNGGGIRGVVATLLRQSPKELENLDTKHVLVLGISKDINANLTDTIMVASYNPNTQRASIISISRDTFVGKNTASAKATDKLNSIYAQKGIESVISKVEGITGLEIEDYVIVNNNALIEIVNEIGGVEFDVPIDMEYDDPTQDLHIRLNKGIQKIDGQKAEWLLRFRHNNDGTSYPASYGDNDMGRMKTQRDFIKATLKQTLNVKNIFNVKGIIDCMYNNVETSLEKDEISAYITCLTEFSTDNLETYAFPGESKKCNGFWFVVFDKKEVKELISDIENHLEN
jgi:LCP family protein required for cell wall assembly